ncbi:MULTISPECIES: taurine ABC transporter substrate-binding protein [unclassified Ensifer]|uniref:taurine ABC transporter substrate-binding protein n=1 Tax=unclassified Ensifer TaxID=2633371 RepID=UPI00070B98E0|nr:MULTISPECIES: taurine ABC transporter substrate-binding protein [unclassified Ensifer]MDP9634485.1 taurine transport system substrate-binding protein [Ensifer adhaerens]KQU87938.1 taurine ABC transporter substrate-binding protein [Ensifer sp. Root31]KQW50838.1 taurine ABC transporter substrate-binding protein [Ensifer sp. Root1252]KQW72689.1 taurine ABC transporter substrate-binding protein [Ensifer sp. Root127]KQY68873.1 taurine ABC transporter substrate-binding protein [Ensifer sp. Root14
MTIARRTLLVSTAALVLATQGLLAAQAADTTLTIGYQPIVEPSRVPQADGTYEKVTGAKINWQKFDGGADVIAALASGSIDIGYVGSSPLAAAASRELPFETIFVVGLISDAEALAVKGVSKPEELAGKKIATPFVSTAHYSLLTALKHWNIDPKSVEILNLRPPEIAAAWQRGDIDGAYVWDPVLSEIKKTSTVLATSADVAQWGGPTFDAWIVSKKFAEEHPDIVTGFVKVTGDAYADYRAKPETWNATSEQAEKIARLTGAKPEDVPALLKGYYFPSLEEQATSDLLGGATAKAIAETSAFLLEQQKIPAVLTDYGPYVSARWAQEAAKLSF